MKEKDLLEKMFKGEKLIIILLIAILLVLILGVSKLYSFNSVSTNTSTNETEYNTNYDVSMFKEISSSDIKKETSNKLSVVYIGRETCGWCAAFLPNLWQAQEDYGYKTLYIDLAKIIDFTSQNYDIIDQNAYDTLYNLTGEGYEDYMSKEFGATPMILIMKDNKIVGAQTGYSEYESFEKILNNAGLKK